MAVPPSYEMSTIGGSKGSLQTSGLGGPADKTTTHFDIVAQVDNPDPKPAPAYDNPGYVAGPNAKDLAGAQPTQAMYEGSQDGAGTSGNPSVWHTGQNTTVVVNQPMMRPGPIEQIQAPYPIPTQCFNCQERIITYIYYQPGVCTWAACVGLMLIGCDFGCCFIPFCVDYFKDSVHKCPKCHVILGKYKKF